LQCAVIEKPDTDKGEMMHGAQVRPANLFSKETAARVMVAIVCLSPVLTYALPENPLTRWPWAGAFADFAASLIPGIDQLSRVSEIPEVTRLFMAIAWFVFGPIFLGLFLVFLPITEHSIRNMMAMVNDRPLVLVFLSLIVAPILAWLLWAVPFAAPNYVAWDAISMMNESRFWLGVFGSFSVMLAAACLWLFLKTFSIARNAYAYRAISNPTRKK
jgi:hypothetical protein